MLIDNAADHAYINLSARAHEDLKSCGWIGIYFMFNPFSMISK